ncbi:MAG: hypothetical protein KGL39_35190 [Patescibacteria group bacterium]|nr:hypothetical protein [Patescibacteria group bacterium]
MPLIRVSDSTKAKLDSMQQPIDRSMDDTVERLIYLSQGMYWCRMCRYFCVMHDDLERHMLSEHDVRLVGDGSDAA